MLEFPSTKAEKEFGEKPELAGLFGCIEKLKKKKTEQIRDCVKENN